MARTICHLKNGVVMPKNTLRKVIKISSLMEIFPKLEMIVSIQVQTPHD